MTLSEKQMDHPRFWEFNSIANAVLKDAFKKAGLNMLPDDRARNGYAVTVDKMVSQLLAAHKKEWGE